MSVMGIESLGFTPYVPPSVTAPNTADAPAAGSGTTGAGRVSGPTGPSGAEFNDLVLDGIDRLEGLQDRADRLAVQAATGQLSNLHDYTIAATESATATQLTVAVRNKAVEAFNEIMRMPVG